SVIGPPHHWSSASARGRERRTRSWIGAGAVTKGSGSAKVGEASVRRAAAALPAKASVASAAQPGTENVMRRPTTVPVSRARGRGGTAERTERPGRKAGSATVRGIDPYAWAWDLEAVVLVPALTAAYVAALAVYPAPRWRIACFLAGMGLIVAAFVTPLET